MALDQCVHVRFQAMIGVHALLVKLNLNEAIRVGANNEVHLCPVDHNYFLHIVDDVRQLLWRESLQTAVKLSRSEVAIEDLRLMKPFGAKDLLLCSFVRVVVHKIWHHIVFLFFFWKKTVVVLPVVLIHAQEEGSTMTNLFLFVLLRLSLVLLMLQIHIICIWQVLVVAKKTTTS